MTKETTPPKQTAKPALKPPRRKRTPSPQYSAQQKVQAVLAVWTEKARASDICRELSISPMGFIQWQERAMEGMLQALENRVNLASGEALNPRLRSLLTKRVQNVSAAQISTRLEKIQQSRKEEPQT